MKHQKKTPQSKNNSLSGKVYDTDFIYNITEALSYRLFGKLFVWLPLTPNQITFFGFLLNGLPAVYFFSLGTHLGYLVGVLFCITYAVFDWMDGFVAKSKGLSSHAGGFLDPMLDYVWQHSLVAGLALGVYNSKGQSYLWLVLGFFTLVSLVVANHVGVIFRDKFDFKFRSNLGDFRNEITKNKKRDIFDLLVMQIQAPTSFIFNFLFTIRYPLFFGALFNLMDIVLLLILFTQFTRALSLSITYALYLDREATGTKRAVIRALEPRELKLAS